MSTNFLNPPTPPKHVAIIMDGNGRWAQQRNLPRIEGHRHGVENVREIVHCTKELGIQYLTLYAFSVENWKRPENEVSALMNMLVHFLNRELNDIVKNKIRLRVLGRPEEMPEKVQQALNKTIEASKHFTERTLNLALNYGSRTEILDAVKSYAQAALNGEEDPKNLDWSTFSKHLYTKDIPDPDLIIRTSGETRLSNFLLMQSAYSEFYFTPTLWPDFGAEQLKEAINSFHQRERRYGKTGEQIQSVSQP